MSIANSLVTKAKMLAYREVYLELLKDERIPYDFCQKVKEKIKNLEKILFVDEMLDMDPLVTGLFNDDQPCAIVEKS